MLRVCSAREWVQGHGRLINLTQEELAAVEQVLEWAAARGLSKRNEAGTAVALRRRAEAGPATAEPAATPTPRDMQGAESL